MKNAESLTKRDIAVRLCEETNLTQSQAYDVIQKVLDCIADHLVEGNHVEFRNFGVFDIVTRKARVGRNPHRPENEVMIPERKIVKFKASRSLLSRLNKAK